MGSAGPRSPFAALKAGAAGAGAPSREEAQPLARPAGEAEDTGGCAALDGRSARRGHASRHRRRAGRAQQREARPKAQPFERRTSQQPDITAQQKGGWAPNVQMSPFSAKDRML